MRSLYTKPYSRHSANVVYVAISQARSWNHRLLTYLAHSSLLARSPSGGYWFSCGLVLGHHSFPGRRVAFIPHPCKSRAHCPSSVGYALRVSHSNARVSEAYDAMRPACTAMKPWKKCYRYRLSVVYVFFTALQLCRVVLAVANPSVRLSVCHKKSLHLGEN